MIGRALSADFLKNRGKGIWLLAIIAPIGIIAMQAINFGLRYDYMMKIYAADPWGGLIENISFFVPIALFLGSTLVCSLMANVENQLSSWKQLLALPISRTAVFSAKFVMVLLVLSFSCVLLSAGTPVLGYALRMDMSNIPYGDMIRLGFAPLMGVIPVLALQLWLSLTLKNQGIAISFGVTVSVVSMFSPFFPDWVPITWPFLAYHGPGQSLVIAQGLVLGAIITLMGLIHFNRRDVN